MGFGEKHTIFSVGGDEVRLGDQQVIAGGEPLDVVGITASDKVQQEPVEFEHRHDREQPIEGSGSLSYKIVTDSRTSKQRRRAGQLGKGSSR